MADLTITQAAVLVGANAQTTERTVGESGGLQIGDLVYLDQNDRDDDGVGKAKKADANNFVGTAAVDGMCVSSAGLGQKVIVVQADGDLTIGATLVPAQVYVASATPGKIAPITDMSTGWYLTPVGYSKDSTKMNFFASPTRVARTTTTTTTSTTSTTTTTT